MTPEHADRSSKQWRRWQGLRPKRPGRGVAWVLPVALTVSLSLVACSDEESKDPEREADYTIELDGGGSLTVPAAAIPGGAAVTTSTDNAPGLPEDQTGLAQPVDIHLDTGAQPSAPVTLIYPYDPQRIPDGLAASDVFGISTYNEDTEAWQALPVTFDSDTKQMSAELTSFSWKWPWEWDWAGIGANINQAAGELFGKRAAPAKCESGIALPAWTSAETTNDAAVALRSCAEGDPDDSDTAVVQLANNRPYGMIINSPVPLAWTWHNEPDDVGGLFASAVFASALGPNQVYLPPLSTASIGVRRGDWTFEIFSAEPTSANVLVEFVSRAVGGALTKSIAKRFAGPFAGACVAPLIGTGEDLPVAEISDVSGWLLNSSGCLREALSAGVADGILDSVSVGRIDSTYRAMARFGVYSAVFNTEWDLVDLLVDQMLVPGPNTFSLTAHGLADIDVAPYLGTWTGPVDQPSSSTEYSATVGIFYTGGQLTANIGYPELSCESHLAGLHIEGTLLSGTEHITEVGTRCIDEGSVTFTALDNGTLRYHWEGGGDLTATAILTRSG